MSNSNKTANKEYDFLGRDHKVALSQDELKHFKESMLLKNRSRPANEVDMEKAVQATIRDLDKLLS